MSKMRENMPISLGKPPRAKNNNISKVMRSNKAKNTRPELTVRKALRVNGLRGYRLHPKKVPGRPDICFIGKRVAIFVNGCFWHRCPHCKLPLPKTNREFWRRKFLRNIERDRLKEKRLIDDGWTVLTFWECQIKRDTKSILEKIMTYLG
jgi:DNA mismatch endonuclease (patch repair protein)